MSNIAEELDRRLGKELSIFLTIAYESIVEVQDNLHIALKIKHILKTEFYLLYQEANKIAQQIK